MAASSGAWSFRSGYPRQNLQDATPKERLHPAVKSSTTTKKTNQIQFNWDNAYFNQQWQAWRVWNEQRHLLTNNYCLHVCMALKGGVDRMMSSLTIPSTFMINGGYKTDYYINTNEIPGELSRENLISSHVKITCYLHMWKYHHCYVYIINRAFHTKKLLKWNGLVFHWCLYNK